MREIGINGILLAFCIVFFTFIFGYIVGVKLLKMDKELAILCSAGSSICGAATQSVLRNVLKEGNFVVILNNWMFLFPLLDRLNIFEVEIKKHSNCSKKLLQKDTSNCTFISFISLIHFVLPLTKCSLHK